MSIMTWCIATQFSHRSKREGAITGRHSRSKTEEKSRIEKGTARTVRGSTGKSATGSLKAVTLEKRAGGRPGTASKSAS